MKKITFIIVVLAMVKGVSATPLQYNMGSYQNCSSWNVVWESERLMKSTWGSSSYDSGFRMYAAAERDFSDMREIQSGEDFTFEIGSQYVVIVAEDDVMINGEIQWEWLSLRSTMGRSFYDPTPTILIPRISLDHPAPVPEPSTWVLLTVGLLCLIRTARKRS